MFCSFEKGCFVKNSNGNWNNRFNNLIFLQFEEKTTILLLAGTWIHKNVKKKKFNRRINCDTKLLCFGLLVFFCVFFK